MSDRRATMAQLPSINEGGQPDNLNAKFPVNITQLTQLLFCGISSCAVIRSSINLKPVAIGTFTFLLGHGVLGFIKYTVNENYKGKLRPVHIFSSFLTRILPLPLINTQIFLDLHYSKLVAVSHAASAILPLSAHVLSVSPAVVDPLIKVVVLLNAGSLAYISVLNENYWILGLSMSAISSEMVIDYLIDSFQFLSPIDWWTSALGTFVMIAIKALESV